jgi:hypothetical protein
MRTPLPKFSEKTVEDLLIAAIRLRTAEGLVIQVPLNRVFTKEFLSQVPVPLAAYGGQRGR